MNNIELSIIFIFFLFCAVNHDTLLGQTYVDANIGVSNHYVEPRAGSEVLLGQDYSENNENFDLGVGLRISHYITSDFFVSLNSNLGINEHQYTVDRWGFNYRSVYSYRDLNFGMEAGFRFYENFEIGIGVSQLVFFDRKEMHLDVFHANLETQSYLIPSIMGSYQWKRLYAELRYMHRLFEPSHYDFVMASFSIGYRLKVFDPAYGRKSKVKCPSF